VEDAASVLADAGSIAHGMPLVIPHRPPVVKLVLVQPVAFDSERKPVNRSASRIVLRLTRYQTVAD
jgi:hypothetical protein